MYRTALRTARVRRRDEICAGLVDTELPLVQVTSSLHDFLAHTSPHGLHRDLGFTARAPQGPRLHRTGSTGTSASPHVLHRDLGFTARAPQGPGLHRTDFTGTSASPHGLRRDLGFTAEPSQGPGLHRTCSAGTWALSRTRGEAGPQRALCSPARSGQHTAAALGPWTLRGPERRSGATRRAARAQPSKSVSLLRRLERRRLRGVGPHCHRHRRRRRCCRSCSCSWTVC